MSAPAYFINGGAKFERKGDHMIVTLSGDSGQLRLRITRNAFMNLLQGGNREVNDFFDRGDHSETAHKLHIFDPRTQRGERATKA